MSRKRDWMQAWHAAAQTLGGRVETPSVLGEKIERLTTLTVEAEGVPVRVEVGVGYDSEVTEISAPAAGAERLKLRFYRGFVYSLQKKLLGVQDIETGDHRFDDTFVVKGNDDEYVRAWLGDEVRARALEVDYYSFAVNGGKARARRFGIEEDERALVRAIRVVGALAAQGRRLFLRWRETAVALGATVRATREAFAPDGSVAIEVVHRGAIVLVDGWFGPLGTGRRRRMMTRVRCRRTSTRPDPFVIYRETDNASFPRRLRRLDLAEDDGFASLYRVHAVDEWRTRTRLRPHIRRLVLDASPDAVVADEADVAVFVRGFETRPDRLEPLVDLAEALVASEFERPPTTDGPYR